MKRFTLLSIVAVAIVLGGCGDDAKKAATETATKVTQKSKEIKKEAVDATTQAVAKSKDVADSAIVAAKEAGNSIKDATDEAVQAAKKSASDVVEVAKDGLTKAEDTATKTVATSDAAGTAAYAKCVACHGADGKTKALGKSAVIAGQSKEELVGKLKEYKRGARDVAGMGALMKGQVAPMSDEDIETVSAHIAMFN